MWTRCAACKFLRRRCAEDCVLAPHFPPTHPDRFACVHRIFGAGNVTRMLEQIPAQERGKAADAISYEAYLRVQDPVYGSVGVVSQLQQEIRSCQAELARTRAQIAMHRAAAAAQTSSSTLHVPARREGEIQQVEEQLFSVEDFLIADLCRSPRP